MPEREGRRAQLLPQARVGGTGSPALPGCSLAHWSVHPALALTVLTALSRALGTRVGVAVMHTSLLLGRLAVTIRHTVGTLGASVYSSVTQRSGFLPGGVDVRMT